MLRWITRTGYSLLALGVFLLSPLADLLPLSAAPLLARDFSHFDTSPRYYRVAPGPTAGAYVVPLALVIAGGALVATAWVLRRRQSR